MNASLKKELEIFATKERLLLLEGIFNAKAGHPGGSLSIAELMAYLYNVEMKIDAANPKWEDRDRFVLSKGHAAPALYATLALKGFFPTEDMKTLRKADSYLQGHPSMKCVPGVDMSTGSLGQGVSAAVGMALAAKLDNKDFRVYTILGDGEIEEGQVWEAAMFANAKKLDNLVVIVDNNNLQIDGTVEEVNSPYPIPEKFTAFGFNTIEIDGNNFDEIEAALENAKACKGKPTAIVAKTVKGKGVSYMENQVNWHGAAPNEELYNQAVTELTAKPLLGFFFPELNYEQPLSGQFAGKRSALSKIRFEKDYGVDVGIVLDADVHGIKILEVDIGDISHDMSPLADLNKMANEVVRTIIDRAVEYGRVTMMDKLGNYIRMAIMGLSLIILGLFMIFFVPAIPLLISVFVAFVGIVLTILYNVKIIKRSIPILKKSNSRASIQSFIRMHFPVIVSGLILILMLSTFLAAATFDDGRISVELTSRNFVYAPSDHNQQTISVRGPYVIDSAIENETDLLRIPNDAMSTLEMSENDTMMIDGRAYLVNSSREGESDTCRLPSKVRHRLGLHEREVIPNSRVAEVFQGIIVKHNIQFNNLSDEMEGFVEFSISPVSKNATFFNLTLDNESILSSVGNFKANSSYSIFYNGNVMCSFDHDDIEKGNMTFTFANQDGRIEFEDRNSTSLRNYVSSDKDAFVQLYSL